ncbi:MAG: flap endonuclease [Sandaracinus sp.]|nr:flap endonuclease [Sandaracinus sp.]MCB9620998.1 flap endonuclease [Sandaracinus sp.]MCB9622913.1 flap endonuclease [Sandaracinus sp.]
MHVHLVDGTYELFRMFYGAPSSTDAEGREVGATRALMRNLATLVKSEGVSHVAVAFDTVIESFRNDLFAGYKTGEGIDPALHGQFPLVEEACRALGIVTWSMVEFEADDAIATFAARASADPRVEKVLLASPDKDLLQCVEGTRVVQLDRRKDVELDEDATRAKLGVSPASVPDYLALVGDTADGIPGVPRWGAKGAAAVLTRWVHLDAIPADPKAWGVKVRGADALAASLNEHREAAWLYRTLATLRRDVPLEESVDDLEWRGPAPELADVAARLGANELVAKLA